MLFRLFQMGKPNITQKGNLIKKLLAICLMVVLMPCVGLAGEKAKPKADEARATIEQDRKDRVDECSKLINEALKKTRCSLQVLEIRNRPLSNLMCR